MMNSKYGITLNLFYIPSGHNPWLGSPGLETPILSYHDQIQFAPPQTFFPTTNNLERRWKCYPLSKTFWPSNLVGMATTKRALYQGFPMLYHLFTNSFGNLVTKIKAKYYESRGIKFAWLNGISYGTRKFKWLLIQITFISPLKTNCFLHGILWIFFTYLAVCLM